MAKVVFSSWGNKIVDNRGRTPDQFLEAPGIELPSQDNHGNTIGGAMGWDGIIVTDERVSVVAMARTYMDAVVKDICGRCTTCRQGNRLILAILDKIAAGNGTMDDVASLEELTLLIRDTVMCSLGQSPMIPIIDSLKYFRNEYLQLIESRSPVNKTKCKVLLTAPCQNACPIHLDIPGYVELIKGERYGESLDLIRDKAALPGVLGRVCVQFCEHACRRGALDEPICIKTLKRHVSDYELAKETKPEAQSASSDKPKVAIIGAGPAGLAAAYYLGLRHHKVTVFEALPVGGGMAAVGIPPYRLPKDVLNREIDIIKDVGVEILYNTPIGKDLSIKDLKDKGYQAIFIGVGCHNSGKMGVTGEEAGYDGFIPGVTFLRDLNLGNTPAVKERVAIVGGGNVAMDCARSALRLGFREVNLIYRRTKAEMPANQEEIEDAEKEGILFHFLTNPTQVLAQNGKVVGIELQRMELGEPDSSGRRRPVPIAGSEFVMDVDVVIPAIGQVTDLSFMTIDDGIKTTKKSTIEVDSATLSTSQEGIFAGGDCVTGPATLVEALAAGNRAAFVIDRYLRGESLRHTDEENMEEVFKKLGLYNLGEDVPTECGRQPAGTPHQPVRTLDAGTDAGCIGARPRPHQVARPVDLRITDFEEVELGFEPHTAVSEAERCFRCYRIGLVATVD